jgi:hypothetical protein
MRYLEIKRVDIEMVDIERSEEGAMKRWMAAAPWEVEAERRQEVLHADAQRVPRSVRSERSDLLATIRRRLEPAVPEQGRRLDQKRV